MITNTAGATNIVYPDPKTQLAAALVKAQAEFKSAIKEANNPFFKSKYADLTSVWEACSDALKKYGLAISQSPGQVLKDPARMELKTTIIHESGAESWSIMEIPLTKLDPQGLGSAITYARRYSLAAILGIVVQDDDGNKGTHAKKQSVKPGTPTISRDEANSIGAMAQEYGWQNHERQNLLHEFEIEDIYELPKDKIESFKATLRGDKK